MTYAELDARARRCAAAILGVGLSPGANVGIMARNLPDYPVVHFGAARSGRVLVHVSTRYAPNELAYVLDNADVGLLIVEPSFLATLEPLHAKLPKLERVIALGRDFDDFLAAAPECPTPGEIRPDDPFAMTFTGGTTGFPKGVLVSHRSRIVSARSGATAAGLTDRDIVCVATPLFHVAGLFVLYQPAVHAGATAVLLEQWSPEAFVDLVGRERVSMAFLVPSQINQLLRWPGFHQAKPRLASLKKLSFAGAPMPDQLQRDAAAELPGVELIQNYGQSEFACLTWLPPERLGSKLGSVGRAGPEIEIAVLRADGRPAAAGEVGEIVSRGAHTMIGYYKKPEETQEFFKDGAGWGHTGDVGYFDADGFLYLVDRSKDMIISGGENVFPKEIENVIHEMPAVAECAVFGVPHADWGEVPKAYVVLKSGQTISEADIVAHCERHLARFKRPREVKFVADLPRTAIGKIQKNLLRAPYWRNVGRTG